MVGLVRTCSQISGHVIMHVPTVELQFLVSATVNPAIVESAALELMEVGPTGATGQLVRKPVKLESNRERGSAPNQCRKMAGNHVKGYREQKRSAVTSNRVQLMEVGQIGVSGLLVAKNVAQAFKSVLVTAANQSLILMENLARERLKKFESATTTVKKTYSVVCCKIVPCYPMSAVLLVCSSLCCFLSIRVKFSLP